MKLKKIISIETLFKIIFVFSLYFSFIIGELFFYSTNSPDYSVYSKYFDYFNGDLNFTNREQGLLYFFISYIPISLKSMLVNLINEDLISHSSIQFTNFILYSVGLVGMYRLLRIFNFDKSNIFISFTLINFFPVGLMLRWTFKPEILIFALLPWVLYFLELFLRSNEIKYLYTLTLPLVLIMTSKGPVIAMVGILMIYYFIKCIKKVGFSELLKPFLFFVAIYLLISYENFIANNRLFYDYQDLDQTIFNNPADLNILYNINFYDIFFSPFRHYHYDSLPGIILLDTYGDYFFWYFDNDKSLFGINSVNLLEKISFLNQYSTSLYQSQLVTLCFSIFTIFLLIFYIIKFKKFRTFLTLPIIGVTVLSMQALGFSSFLIDKNINFDKSTSDIFKMFYLGFFIIISFLFLYNLFLENFKTNFKVLIIVFYLICMFVIYGFPIEITEEFKDYLEEKNNVSYLCKFNSHLLNLSSENCNNENYQICLPNDRYLNNDYILQKIPTTEIEKFVDREIKYSDDLIIRNLETYEECIDSVSKIKRKPVKKSFIANIPYLNLLVFVLSLFSFVHTFRRNLNFPSEKNE